MKAERWCEVGVSCCVQLAVYRWLCAVGRVQLAVYRWLRTVGCVQYDLWRHVYTMQGCIPEKAWKIGHVAPCVYHVGVYTPKSLGNSDSQENHFFHFFPGMHPRKSLENRTCGREPVCVVMRVCRALVDAQQYSSSL